ncbi:MAG: response regulator [Gallionellaceae bacterium]|nr:MAG: response regulator [Gallionellaceae bacterium]
MFGYGAHYPTFLAFFLPMMLPALAALATRQSIFYAGMAGGVAVFTLVGMHVGRRFNRNVLDSLRLRFENLDLIERLREETKKAENASLAKSKFLAAASHDLRQPIHALGLFLELIGRGELSATQREMLENARASTGASAEMLNTLLDFSRIEAGVITPQVRPFHLLPLLNKIESELAPLAIEKGLVFRSRETHAAALSDPVLVELILRNLVSNAIRYTERGGVLLACRARGDAVWLEVWDTGIGIPPAQQQEIFRDFHQLGNPERDRTKGLGLGLAIVDGLTRTLKHKLSVKSIPSNGSVFRLALPVSRAAVIADEPKTLPGQAGKLHARVLVIDDDEAVRTGMLKLLVDWGCECTAVESIEDALAAARTNRPDVVISDYRLREQRTGAEAIAALRAECGDQLPALLITGDTAPERLREALASNVPLLHKPVSPDYLYRKMLVILPG